MAKKKLLFVLILVIGGAFNVNADQGFAFKKEDLDFAKDMAKRARQTSMIAIKEKWLELQKMQANASGQFGFNEEDIEQTISSQENGATLRVFVSSSMNKELLKQYVEEAKRYKAILVFNGLPQGSWRKLGELIYQITGGTAEASALQIDDISFKKYSVTSVPSFVLSTEEDVFEPDKVLQYDKVAGNIGIKRALEEITKKGELASFVREILEGV